MWYENTRKIIQYYKKYKDLSVPTTCQTLFLHVNKTEIVAFMDFLSREGSHKTNNNHNK